MAKNNNDIQNDLTGAFAFNKKAKSNTNKSPFKQRQPKKPQRRVNNYQTKKQPVKTENTKPKKRPIYPWTCLLDVKLVAQLDAIQKSFNLDNRSEALALILDRSFKGGLIKDKKRSLKYRVFYDTFMERNLPKAKRHYDKYFHK